MVVALAVVSMVSAVWFADPYSGDYPFFVTAYRNLTNRDGLYVYHWMPHIQSGPVSLLAYGAASLAGLAGFPVLVALLGLVVLAIVARWCRQRDRSLAVLGIGGLVLVLEWRSLATWGHLDDALVLVIVMTSLVALERRRPGVAVLLLGLALAIKPWVVMFVPLTLATEGAWWRRLSGPATSVAVGSLFWLPFVVTSPDTLDGIRPSVEVARDSIVHLVARDGLTSVPAALRMAQLLLGVAVVTWTVVRGRLSCALLAGIAVRLLFEAATWPYYTAALVLGALVWDVLESRAVLPWATITAAVLVFPPWWFDAPDVRASMRLVACLGALELVRRTVTRPGLSSAEGGAGAARGGEDVLVELDAESGCVGELDPTAV